MSVIFRTSGPWGTGKGTDLDPVEVDGNFWQLIQDVAAKAVQGVGISNIVVMGDQLTVVLTDHTLLGPYTLPTVQLSFQGEWQPNHVYVVNDIITHAGSTYIVTFNHTSAATFDPGANDGSGHDFYGLLLQNPALTIPTGGAAGTLLRKVTNADYAMAWATLALRELNDVSVVTPAEGEILTYLHGVWTNSVITAALHDLSDVNISSPLIGQVLTWNGSFWENASGITTLDGLQDVSLVAPAPGQVLTFSGSPGFWINETPSFPLADLSDVQLGTLYPNQPLIYNAAISKWGNLNAADMLVNDVGNQAGNFTLDLTSFEFNRVSLVAPANPVFVWPNLPGQFVRRAVEINNTGPFTFFWPAGIKWPGGVMPTVTPSGVDIFVLFTHDAGTTVYGNTVGQGYVPG